MYVLEFEEAKMVREGRCYWLVVGLLLICFILKILVRL
jgi:hypothetical protein